MKFLAGVIVGLVVAPSAQALYKKNQEEINWKVFEMLQGIANKSGFELHLVEKER
jgi:hypothetical protein